MSRLQVRPARSFNPRSATGPRTAAGKARSRQNAYRHGLAVPVCSDPLIAAKVDEVARQIAGSGASEAVLQIARRAAEAHLDVIRCRQARCRAAESAAIEKDDLLLDAMSDQTLREFLLRSWWDHQDKDLPEDTYEFSEAQEDVIERHRERIRKRRERSELNNLLAIDRYERRALSRRNRAIEQIDCQRILEALPSRRVNA